MKRETKLTSSYLNSLLSYVDGKLLWKSRPSEHFKNGGVCKAWNTKYSGKEAGLSVPSNTGSSYHRWEIRIDGKRYHRHRLVWCMVHDEWPAQIDHKDTNSLNDRIGNLRLATTAQNRANSNRSTRNTSGYKGVTWEKRRKKWQSYVTVEGKYKFLGYFDDPALAHAAYVNAARAHYGEFARAQ